MDIYSVAFVFHQRLVGSHHSISDAREACIGDGGQLLSLARAQDVTGALSFLASRFRVQGSTAGVDGTPGTCWTDGQGNEVTEPSSYTQEEGEI